MHAQELDRRIAVVTGASRGIGRHIAAALLEGGATVAITGRDEATILAAADELGERAHGFVCDQRIEEQVTTSAAAIVERLGPPDLLVCNAGVMLHGTVAEIDLSLWRQVIDTNLTGTFLTVKAFLPSMLLNPRGDIFIISSMSGKKGDPGASAYAASKFGLQGFAQSLMHELRRSDIRVMVLNPSSVDTGVDEGPSSGKGLYLHAADLGAVIAHLAELPGRTLIRDMDIYGTNPFRD